METSIIFAGFGGQGVLFAGQLLAYAGMEEGRHVTWIPSYGPEMRGGTANCTVIISDEPIGAPVVARPDVAVVLNLPSYDKYEPLVKPGGLLVVNSSIVTAVSTRTDLEIVYVPANALAEEYGATKMMNVAAVGALLARRPLLPLTAVSQTLAAHLPASKQHLVEANLRVLQAGWQAAGEVIGER
ncbi:MAG: 2-oxoacid:acceptor oxidoreductase family protein [Chloroflexi bacterium]|nr:2-oxoacid:acceptor oxidoreductase family protein [Ardenticatenaceae bacterium]MBL1127152.1 2-oxoacid:ferredoxin oxidoreductase subunit gamma [Chloroflexota bacterium]NOG33211.1 2-oxoacid:acceptor oxidoreductase family protein [Chloroflexota bacterium]GIK55007.1 MAG: 2-oxoacid:ferredoxin oxidoreductase subunit gamma [Chloroflexota bacterium]